MIRRFPEKALELAAMGWAGGPDSCGVDSPMSLMSVDAEVGKGAWSQFLPAPAPLCRWG